MAITVATSASGTDVATDTVSSEDYQIVKLAYGAAGSATLASAANPWPVTHGTEEQSTTGVDLDDTASVGASLEIGNLRHVCLWVRGTSGTPSTCVVTLQVSPDGTNWVSSSSTVTGNGYVDVSINARYVRWKVTTAEGSSMTGEVYLHVK